MIEIPHIRLPLTLLPGGGVNAVEQDSQQEIAQNVQTILSYEKGQRVSQPEFGIHDPTFTISPNTSEIQNAIDDWEPRARYTLDLDQNLEDLTANIKVILEGGNG